MPSLSIVIFIFCDELGRFLNYTFVFFVAQVAQPTEKHHDDSELNAEGTFCCCALCALVCQQ